MTGISGAERERMYRLLGRLKTSMHAGADDGATRGEDR